MLVEQFRQPVSQVVQRPAADPAIAGVGIFDDAQRIADDDHRRTLFDRTGELAQFQLRLLASGDVVCPADHRRRPMDVDHGHRQQRPERLAAGIDHGDLAIAHRLAVLQPREQACRLILIPEPADHRTLHVVVQRHAGQFAGALIAEDRRAVRPVDDDRDRTRFEHPGGALLGVARGPLGPLLFADVDDHAEQSAGFAVGRAKARHPVQGVVVAAVGEWDARLAMHCARGRDRAHVLFLVGDPRPGRQIG